MSQVSFPEPDNGVFNALNTSCVTTMPLLRKPGRKMVLNFNFPVVVDGEFVHIPSDKEDEFAAASFTPA